MMATKAISIYFLFGGGATCDITMACTISMVPTVKGNQSFWNVPISKFWAAFLKLFFLFGLLGSATS